MNTAARIFGIFVILQATSAWSQVPLPNAKPVPRLQVIPLPNDTASFRLDGVELAGYHSGTGLRRPFLYPLNDLAGHGLTRMGHPHDPVTHSHHNSVWISHNDVDGQSFWDDRGPGRIVQQKIIRYNDLASSASIVSLNAWLGANDRVLINERRGITAEVVSPDQWLLTLDLQLEAVDKPVTLGKTPFGMVGVRLAKTIGVNDGGGTIRNSEGNVDEKGPNGVFWKRARWVDYSGPITDKATGGITLFDHPSNPNHPTFFHVRKDGWMGASLTFDAPITITPGKPLRLRYGLLMHSDVPCPDTIEGRWKTFAEMPVKDIPTK